jgi:hypothetical protein
VGSKGKDIEREIDIEIEREKGEREEGREGERSVEGRCDEYSLAIINCRTLYRYSLLSRIPIQERERERGGEGRGGVLRDIVCVVIKLLHSNVGQVAS